MKSPAGKSFSGFPPRAITFFRQLSKNNSRDWFAPRKDEFQQLIYLPMIDAVTIMNDQLRKFAVHYVTDPKKAIYRLYRDTRFAKDKTPYKTHLGATFHHHKFSKNNAAGLYFSISHKEVEVAGGMYMPDPEAWRGVRKTLEANLTKFEKIINDKSLRKLMGNPVGQKLARVPKAFDADSPAGEYLKHTQFYFYAMLDAKMATSPKLINEVITRFKVLLPLVDFLNNAALSERKKEDETDRPLRPAAMF